MSQQNPSSQILPHPSCIVVGARASTRCPAGRMPQLLALVVTLMIAAPAMAAEGEWTKHVVYEGQHTNTAVAGDFTGDGQADIISNSGGVCRLFTAPDWQEIAIHADREHNCIHSAAFDVDGDGDLDWIGARYNPGLIFWLENPNSATKTPWDWHVIDVNVHGIHGLLAGDVDGDGRTDLVANSAQPKPPFPESLVWYRVPDDPKQPWDRFIAADRDAPGLTHYLGLGDINGDGRADILTGAKGGPMAKPGSGDWFAWWQAPEDPEQRAWKKSVIAADQPGATNVLPVDVNRDGTMDVIASRGHGQGVIWLEGPDWTEHAIAPELTGPHCLAIGDIDGDGDIDATTCAKDDKVCAWFENDGKGRFTTHVIGTDQAAYDIRLFDMDSDEDLDVIVAGQTSRNVVWYENPTR
ncbi:FG-GAP repeat protein [Maioricimonas rarisocia]|uniref:FG-GAP repeat protein n=2 Tax=Maioricimonas rarisocia TaxID=2528026 RepID=A0A517ZBG8_9PLAN|nr:FG-GAP repeat protein [Maioricimonas rarisocia]